MNEIAIKVNDVSKVFKLPHEKNHSIKGAVVNFYKQKRTFEIQKALSNISFDVKKGEFFGIVGRNGSGKSTLLKLLAGIYTPSKGSIEINGKLTPFIELGVGFNPELTGRENVFLNGALLGFSRNEMKLMYKDIVDFAELERFMDQKLKNYSSGMQVRLAFSIAIRAESQILIMDEVLAVGDASFQKKCFDIFRDLKNKGRTIILVTHDMGNVERFCDRVLVLNDGKLIGITTPQEAASIYAQFNIENSVANEIVNNNKTKNRWGVGGVKVKNINYFNENNKSVKIFEVGKPFKIEINLERDSLNETTQVVCGLAIYNQDGVNVTGPNNLDNPIKKSASKIIINFPPVFFAPGAYSLTVALYNRDSTITYDYLDRTEKFSVISDHMIAGLIEVKPEWTSK